MAAGIIALICFLILLILTPLIFMEAIILAFYKLGIPPLWGLVFALGIFLGSLFNIPIKRYRNTRQPNIDLPTLFGINQFFPRQISPQSEIVIAINLGGCFIPTMIALYQLIRLAGDGYLSVAGAAIIINILSCYAFSRFLPGVGIVLPAFFPGVLAAFCALVLSPENPSPVAFCAGVLGPLVGADMMRLQELRSSRSGVFSIGGAGTFDGIVVSGILALLLS